jgi:hypothetical protein
MAEKHGTYWVQVFTPNTWQQFVSAGSNVTGFRETRWNHIQTIKPGDRILCDLSGISKWIGILEVLSDPYLDTIRIWEEDLFPCRVAVQSIVCLPLECAVPIRELKKLSIFRIKNWSLYLIASPSKWNVEDGEIVAQVLQEAYRRLMK